jgi:hypothetical protein
MPESGRVSSGTAEQVVVRAAPPGLAVAQRLVWALPEIILSFDRALTNTPVSGAGDKVAAKKVSGAMKKAIVSRRVIGGSKHPSTISGFAHHAVVTGGRIGVTDAR